jgi:CubicO group peptidase (beta-lactamase class C family)
MPAAPASDGFGFDPALARRLHAGIEAGLLRHLHAVVAARGNRPVLEYYGAGPDETWGQPLGPVAFGPDTLHDLRSVTKSVVGLLYGIALDRGLVPPPEAPLLAQFPDYADLAADPGRTRLTVEHALTLTLGMEWDENRPYTDPENSEIAMENAADRYRYILERPLVAEPGKRWIYSGGSVALIGALIARGSGMTLEAFAQEALFGPLGIVKFSWSGGRDGIASAASGLRLTARDLLRIGAMLLDKGLWQGRRIVSQAWIEASFRPSVPTGDGLHYGYLWFIGDGRAPVFEGTRPWVAGFGNGGQRLWLMPEAGLAAVIYSGRYNAPDAWVTPTRVWHEIILANLMRA